MNGNDDGRDRGGIYHCGHGHHRNVTTNVTTNVTANTANLLADAGSLGELVEQQRLGDHIVLQSRQGDGLVRAVRVGLRILRTLSLIHI